MPESADAYLPLAEFENRSLVDNVRELLDAVIDVARRLNHNVLAPEHLLVVGSENGVAEMSRKVPSLSAFREALLDSLFDDRDMFRYEPEQDDERLFVKPELVTLLERIQAGEDAPAILAELMGGGGKRVKRALAYARDADPDVIPPDTMSIEAAMESLDSLAQMQASHASAESVARASADAEADFAADQEETVVPVDAEVPALELPLTVNLGKDAVDDPDVVGREALYDQVARILLRFHQPALLLVAPAGSGKTAFVRGLARDAANGKLPALKGFHFYQLKLLDLMSQSHRGQDVHNLVDQLLSVISNDPTGVLVVDDLHLLVAKSGYPMLSDLIDTIKMHITKGKVRALLTVDADAYKKSFGADAFFSSQMTVKSLPALERDTLEAVAVVYRQRLQEHFGVVIEDDAIEAAVAASLADDNSEYVPPGSTIRIIDEACAATVAEGGDRVGADAVHRCVSEEARASADIDRARLKALEARLADRVLGQDAAAASVGRRVRLAKLHLDRKPERPDGVFLFMGPSGVGKTEMARGLARALYDDESRLVRLDMSEYMEPHSVARIIGAPPGYVGYGEEGALTGPVAAMGHAVVLLDEIEKAHPRVLNLFLQVFDDGRLTDSKGRLVDFSECVIIMTSNIGRELYAIHGEKAIGFGQGADTDNAGERPVPQAVQEHLLRVLPSEFVNRIDELVPFRVLEDGDILKIAERLLVVEAERWKARGKRLVIGDGVAEIIALSGYDPRLGARHVERNLERLVISLLSDASVADGFDRVKELALEVDDGVICLDVDGTRFVCLTSQGQVHGGEGGAS